MLAKLCRGQHRMSWCHCRHKAWSAVPKVEGAENDLEGVCELRLMSVCAWDAAAGAAGIRSYRAALCRNPAHVYLWLGLGWFWVTKGIKIRWPALWMVTLQAPQHACPGTQ